MEGAPAPRAAGAAFLGGLGLVLAYALRGGAYDPVAFGEYAVVVWFALAVGLAFGLLPRVRPGWAVLGLLAALTLYAGWQALSLTWTGSSELTLTEVSRTLGYLGLAVLLAVSLDRRSWRACAGGLVAGAGLVCLVADGSRLLPQVIGADPVAAALHTDRLSAPFGYWNALSTFAAMAGAAALVWSAHDRRLPIRTLALAAVPGAVLAVYLTYSRTGIAELVVAGLAALVLSRNRITVLVHALVAGGGAGLVILSVQGSPQVAAAVGTQGAPKVLGALALAWIACLACALLTSRLGGDELRLPRPVSRVALAVLALAVIAAGAVAGPRLATRAWHSFKRPVAATGGDPTSRLLSLGGSRYQLWKAGVKALQAHPVNGTGAGTYAFWWNQHGGAAVSLRDAHSLWFDNAAELGIPGLILILITVLVALYVGWRTLDRRGRRTSQGAAGALLAAFLTFLVGVSVDWMWQSTAVTVVALAGVVIAGGRLARRVPPVPHLVRGLMVAAALGAVVLQAPGLLSTLDLRRSQAAVRAGDQTGALDLASSAIDYEPWSASAHQQRALVEELSGNLGAAAADLDRAVREEPTNYVHWLLLARVRTEQGQPDPARSAYEQARRLRPLGTVFLSQTG